MGIETLAIASLAASVAGAGVSAMGARNEADATAQSYNYKAIVAQNNAIIANRNAEYATASGATKAQTNDLKTRNLVSSQIVLQAANGLDVNSGTNVDLRKSAEDIGHLDTMTILNNAAQRALGYKTQGMNFTAEGLLDTQSATNAETAGDYKVATSLLGGASSFADKWAGYSQKGIV